MQNVQSSTRISLISFAVSVPILNAFMTVTTVHLFTCTCVMARPVRIGFLITIPSSAQEIKQ